MLIKIKELRANSAALLDLFATLGTSQFSLIEPAPTIKIGRFLGSSGRDHHVQP